MSQTANTSGDLDRLDPNEIRRFLRAHWTLILATALVCAALALAVCLSLNPVFTATTQVLLDPHRQHIFGQDAMQVDSALDSSIVDSQIPIITSTRLLAKVINKEHLTEDPEFAAAAKPGLLDRLLGLFKSAKVKDIEQPSLDGIDPVLAPAIIHVFNKVEVQRIAKSNVLSVSVSSRSPAKATRLANSLAQSYVEDQVDVHARSVQQAATFFEQRLGSLRDQVRTSERAVADFRKANNLTTTTMDGKITVNEEQLQDLDKQLALALTDTAEKLARLQQATRFKVAGSSVDTLPDIIRSPLIVQLRSQQADLIRREADISAMYGPAYPAITQIHAQKAGLERAIAGEIRRLGTTLHNDWEVAKAREDSLRTSVGALTQVSGGDNDIGVKLRELERTNMANKALFENFLNRAKLTQEQSSFEEPDARLISPALEPTAPTSPKTKLIVAVAGMVGLVLGLGLAVVADRRGGAPRRGAPSPGAQTALILGRVPDIGHRFGTLDQLRRFLSRHPDSDYARDIAALAAKLAPADASGGQVIGLAPLGTAEDTGSIALSMAAILGANGRRVLLIDMDGARGALTDALGAKGKPGLAEVMIGDLSATKAFVLCGDFTFLSAGAKRLGTAGSNDRVKAFLAEARTRYDVTLLNLPAVGSSEAARACDLVDGLALVAFWDSLLRDSFVAAINAVAEKTSFRGVVLTRPATADDEHLALAG